MRTTIATTIATATLALGLLSGCGASVESRSTEPTTAHPGHYAQVNSLKMYYEVHGETHGAPPLVLLHGGLTTIDSSFGKILPDLAKTRQIIAIEQQGHGRTADIDRPLRYETMADDTVALLDKLGVHKADFFGFSDGAAVALDIGVRHPEVAGRLVLASTGYNPSGSQPGVHEELAQLPPQLLDDSPMKAEYDRIAPRPNDFRKLVERIKDLDAHAPTYTPDQIRSIQSPVLIIAADNDIIRPEHTIEMYRLLGGGIEGTKGLPKSRLAVIPGTSHLTVIDHKPMLLPILAGFLDTP